MRLFFSLYLPCKRSHNHIDVFCVESFDKKRHYSRAFLGLNLYCVVEMFEKVQILHKKKIYKKLNRVTETQTFKYLIMIVKRPVPFL